MRASGSRCCGRLISWIGLGEKVFALLLGSGRKDESGDFTKGAGLDDEQIEAIMQLTFDVHKSSSGKLS